jgi:hypothetical protein
MLSIYYKINHRNKFLFYDNASLANIKSTLFEELSSKNESKIFNNVLNLFRFLLKDYLPKSDDKIYLIFSLIQEFKKRKNIQLESYDKISQNFSRKIIKKNYKMDFDFISEDLDDICTLISLGFTKIFSDKKIKFKTYDEFLQKLEEYSMFFVDLVKIYKSYNFVVPSNAPEIPKGDVPNEILLLKYIFQGIKHITLNLNKMAKNNILPFLIIILNSDWLFPFVFEVDMDLTYEIFHNDINNLYYTNEKLFYINYLKNKPSNYDELYFSDDESEKDGDEINYDEIMKGNQIFNIIKKDFDKNNNSSIKEQLKNDNDINNIIDDDPKLIRNDSIKDNYTNILIKNENTFDVILCFFYLIKKIKYLKALNINMPNGFIKENIDLIKIRNILEIEPDDISNINLFEYISIISSINSFNITFNCLEKKTFENILFMIQNNINLHELKLNFFPDNEINSPNLIKISDECGILKDLNIDKKQENIIMNKNIEKKIKLKLLEYFEINLEKLFLLFQTKKNLEKLEIIIKLPSIFLSNEKENDNYNIVIIKFILNLIILLHKEKLNLKEFRISLPYFNFNNRSYPIIGEAFEKINLLRKNPQLKIFQLEISIFKIYNIQNLISINLQDLQIGELDLETFNFFIQFYQSKEYIENSELKKLNISLNKNVIKYNLCKNSVSNFFSGKNPKNLTEITFKCNFRIKRKNLYDLLKSTNGNNINKYNIIMKIDKLKKYKHIIEHKEFYFFNKDFEKKIMSYLPFLKKYDFLQEKYKKIAKNIIKFLVPSNRKNINIIDIK